MPKLIPRNLQVSDQLTAKIYSVKISALKNFCPEGKSNLLVVKIKETG